MIDPNNKDQEGLRKIIAGGTEIAGGAVGGALGFLAAGPGGAAVLGAGGVLAANALKRVGQEVADRMLGPREKIRVGAVVAIAAMEIKGRIDKGEALRDDAFFETDASGRSRADSVVESILLKSQREPEEKKIQFMGHLLSNIAFDKTISGDMAHQIIKVAEDLTYRELCILRLSAVKEFYTLRASDYRGYGPFPKELYQVLYECMDLYHRGLINFGGSVGFGPTDVTPNAMTIQGLGADLYNLMSLAEITDKDILPIAAELK